MYEEIPERRQNIYFFINISLVLDCLTLIKRRVFPPNLPPTPLPYSHISEIAVVVN